LGESSEAVSECLLKWFHLPAGPFSGQEPAACDQLTVSPVTKAVNTATQYVVDISSGTHDIAPALSQVRVRTAIAEFGGNRRSCGNLSRNRADNISIQQSRFSF
jgi:hypothetical protein